MTTAELIERLERAEWPSRELDAEIDAFLGWAPLANPTSAGGLIDMMVSPSGETVRRTVPHYTASIDAALTLVPEGWRIAGFVEYGNGMKWKGRIYCALVPSDLSHLPRTYAAHSAAAVRCDHAATPAIALCIAALKAKEADNGNG